MLQKLLAFHRRLPGLAPIVMIATVFIGGISYVGANTTKVDAEIGCPVTAWITIANANEIRTTIQVTCDVGIHSSIIRTGDGTPGPKIGTMARCRAKLMTMFGGKASPTEVPICWLPT